MKKNYKSTRIKNHKVTQWGFLKRLPKIFLDLAPEIKNKRTMMVLYRSPEY